jgi:hypothetical protein
LYGERFFILAGGIAMRLKIAVSAPVLAIMLLASANAQPVVRSSDENWRFKLQRVDGGFLRLDAQTGQVSFCREKDTNWTCETVADDRAALEAEIKRLNDRVAVLEKQTNDPSNRFRTPSDQEIEQVMGFFEKMMKRFRGVVETLKKEWQSEGRS